MFKLTSLNLNGLRSATTKGVADWVAELAPDCICMQEIRVQASDIEGRFEQMAGLQSLYWLASMPPRSSSQEAQRDEYRSDFLMAMGRVSNA